jgi:general secretion pathway protein J
VSRGLTLLELIVALAILSAILALLADGLRLAARTSTALEATATRSHEVYAAGRLLARQVEQARRLSGERAAMRFVAGMHSFSLDTPLAEDGRQLVLRFGGRSAVLARRLETAQFDYFASGAWASHWDEAERLPRLIRVRLTSRDDTSRHWPELLLAPRLAASRPET